MTAGQSKHAEWAPVATYPSVFEADLGHATLAAAGIESVVVTDDVGHMYPPLASAGVTLIVHRENLDEARTILNTPPADAPQEHTA